MCKTNEFHIDPSEAGLHLHDHHITLAVLGGDARQLSVCAALADAGCHLRVMGLGDTDADHVFRARDGMASPHVKLCQQLSHALDGCDGMVLPYPSTKDAQTVFSPLDTQHSMTLEDIGRYALKHPGLWIFGGRLPDDRIQSLIQGGCRVIDYESHEAFLIKNARLTAEGAIMTAMELTDTALLNAPVAVIGYGRIGQLLADLLLAMNARVTVYARREESLSLAEARGCHSVPTSQLARLAEGYRIIFNTVPVRLMGKGLLSVMPCDTLIIDLASAPGGLDSEGAREATRRCGLQIIKAPSLPGRYAPKDAGRAIAEVILSELEGYDQTNGGGKDT